MDKTQSPPGEARMACKHVAVSLLGFAVDAALLSLAIHSGLEPAWARVLSLFAAMQVTFVVNRRLVFHRLETQATPTRQWVSYMAGNGLGNLCNYWIFVTLVSTHWRLVSTPLFAVAAASICAWVINYGCTRHLVFGRGATFPPCMSFALSRRRKPVVAESAAAPSRPEGLSS